MQEGQAGVHAGRFGVVQVSTHGVISFYVELRIRDTPWASLSMHGYTSRSIKDFSNKFLDSGSPLHVLINNAGVFIPPDDRTKEDFEVTMGIDHFAPFYLTHLLLQNLQQSAPSRIVNLG